MSIDFAAYDPAKLFNVAGMVAVVTGGGTGVGLTISRALALNGAAKVYILGRRLEKLQEAAEQSPHGNITPIQADVTKKHDLAAAAKHITDEVGHVNLVVANSGVNGPDLAGLGNPQPTAAQLQEYIWSTWSEEAFDECWDVNVKGAFFSSVAFLDLLDKGNKAGNMPGVGSQVLVNSSIASFLRMPGASLPYVASKAASNHMGKVLSTTFAPLGIRVNILNLGLYPSDMTDQIVNNPEHPFNVDVIPAKRLVSEADLISTTLYLCSKAGSYLNGTSFVIDGGSLAVIPSTY